MRRVLSLISLLGVAVLLAACGGGGSDDAAATGGSVQSEGIEVHGDWEITVFNEDGTLDQQYVFANALRSGAGTLLGQLLLVDNDNALDGYPTPFVWSIYFGDTGPGASPCNTGVGTTPGGEPLLTSGCALDGLLALAGITPDGIVTTEAIAGGVRLAGSAVATQAGSINYVETRLAVAVGPGSGGGAIPLPELVGNAITGTDVGPFEGIEAGQSIQVQVDISFASPAP